MVRLSRITTKTGDGGKTSLSDGIERSKSHPRLAAIGGVDEANCAIGVARTHCAAESEASVILQRLQNDLFDVGADLATPHDPENWLPIRVTSAHSAYVEDQVTRINARLQPLNSFVLPAGSALSAALHMARAITRRAEREVVALGELEALSPEIIVYLNRLSDLLFVMARDANTHGLDDVLWVAGLGAAELDSEA